jgi:nucleotide-binding universal stress UspA family protein
MDDKLVTLVTLTYNKALILKKFLEKEGIDVYIANLHPLNPVISSGVRVRIKECDLPQALKITESPAWLAESVVGEKTPVLEGDSEEILVPVDFSEYSMRVCEIAFHIADKMHYQITLMHVYLTSMFATLPYSETFNLPLGNDNKDIKNELANIQKEIDDLSALLDKRIEVGELPHVKYNCILKEGIPEEEILRYSKEKLPKMIIMGTRGKHKKDVDLMGSVTAEVIERGRVSILAIPENTPLKDFQNVKHIAFITNFEQFDLIAFDTFIKSWKNNYHFSISLLHLEGTHNTWNEIKLAGIKDYFLHQYPSLDIHYDVVKDDDLLKSLDKYIKDNKIDIIALTSRKRNVFSRLFNPSIAQRMIFHSDTPLMVLNINSVV